MPGQWLAAATPKGCQRAEVHKSDRQPARVGRDVASAEADRALHGPEATPGLAPRCGARAAPRTRSPSRPDWQRPFSDGRAGRSRGPCRRGVASTGRLGRAGLRAAGQCVSAWGRNSNAASAEQASFAARNGCESWGRSLPQPLGPGRHRWSGHRSWQGRSGRRLPGACHLGPVSGTGSRVTPGSGPGAARWRR